MNDQAPAQSDRHRLYELDEYLPYLLNHVGGRLAASFAPELNRRGLTMTSWRVMHTLWHTGPLRLAQLAMKANFDLSTLSRVVVDLENRELLVRMTSARGRRPSVDLSAAGAAQIAELLPLAAALEENASSVLTAGERQILVELLQKLDRSVS